MKKPILDLASLLGKAISPEQATRQLKGKPKKPAGERALPGERGRPFNELKHGVPIREPARTGPDQIFTREQQDIFKALRIDLEKAQREVSRLKIENNRLRKELQEKDNADH